MGFLLEVVSANAALMMSRQPKGLSALAKSTSSAKRAWPIS